MKALLKNVQQNQKNFQNLEKIKSACGKKTILIQAHAII